MNAFFKKATTVLIPAIALFTLSSFTSPAIADYDKSVQLQWQGGQSYTSEIGESFTEMPIVVPGDSAQRTLHIKNSGPTDGNMRISITNVKLQDPNAPDNGNFYNDVKITSTTQNIENHSLTELHDNKTTIVSTQTIKKDEIQDLTIGFDLSKDATSGNLANVSPRAASFDVLIEISGELPVIPDDETSNPTTPTSMPTNSTPSVTPDTHNNTTNNNTANNNPTHQNNSDKQNNSTTKNSPNNEQKLNNGAKVRTGGETISEYNYTLIAGLGILLFGVFILLYKVSTFTKK